MKIKREWSHLWRLTSILVYWTEYNGRMCVLYVLEKSWKIYYRVKGWVKWTQGCQIKVFEKSLSEWYKGKFNGYRLRIYWDDE